MEKIVLNFTFNEKWVFESFLKYDLEPLDYLVNSFKSDKSVKVEKINSTSIRFIVDAKSVDKVKGSVEKLICEKYKVDDYQKVLVDAISGDLDISKVFDSKKVEKSQSDEVDSDKVDSDDDVDIDSVFGKFSFNGEKSKDVKKIEIIGAKGYKDLIEEIVAIAPIVKSNGTEKVVLKQNYLFSINSGDGLSTYLQDFADVLVDLKIAGGNKGTVFEVKLPPITNEQKTLNISPTDLFRRNPTICAIDISEWMNSLETKEFKSFVKSISVEQENSVVVFTVPFLENDVLRNISLSLNDVLFVRTVSILPFSMAELKECAIRQLKEYDYTIDDKAWRIFEQRIMDEKSDGKFYGVKTVNKVVNEIIYHKLVSSVKNGGSDKVISENDIKDLSSGYIETGKTGMEMLSELVGSEKIVEKIKEIIAQINLSKKSNDLDAPSLHMRFVGNPGTGKTTVARIVGKILKENGVLRVGGFFEYSGRDFVGQYIGHTAPKVLSMCRDAYGSVMFIDEAYSLYRSDEKNNKDFGREALDTLIAEMENHRNDMLIIMAGYTDEMDMLMKGNIGLASRMPYTLEFPNFTREQLYEIFEKLVKKKFKYDEDLLTCAKDYFLNISDEVIKSKDFANARFVRNLFERTWGKASARAQFSDKNNIVITKDDFVRATSDKEFLNSNNKKKIREIGFY